MGSSSEHAAVRPAMAKQLKVLLPSSFHKLRISEEFGRHFDAGTPRPTALVVSPFGKVWPVEVDRDGGGAFLGRGWAEFVSAHGFGVGWFLVLRHEGRGTLTVKAFDTSCCLKEFRLPPYAATRSNRYASRKPQFIKVLLPSFMEKMTLKSNRKHLLAVGSVREIERSSGKKTGRPRCSMTSLKKKSSKTKSIYEIGPPSWIQKEINTYVLQRSLLSLATTFCNTIGFRKRCTITLKTSMDSTMSWQVDGRAYKMGKTYLIGLGCKKFCQENMLKEGDLCTFNVVKTTLWHVVVTRCSNRTR